MCLLALALENEFMPMSLLRRRRRGRRRRRRPRRVSEQMVQAGPTARGPPDFTEMNLVGANQLACSEVCIWPPALNACFVWAPKTGWPKLLECPRHC